MTASLIELETLDLVSASRLLRLWVAEPVELATRGLWSTLEGCSAMAGSDPGGAAWARSYDQAAAAAVNAAQDAINGVDMLAGMFAQTARNYEAADSASTPAERGVIEASVATLPCLGSFLLPSCAPASAAGGSGGGPHGWSLIEHLVGYVWPNGHQDRLRRAAAAWRHSAQALAHGADDTVEAAQRAVADRLPEAGDIWTVCNGMSSHLAQLSGVHSALAGACEELAQHIDQVHSEVVGELTSLLEWTAAIEAGGAALSVVTFGTAEAPTQAVEAARIAKTAARVAALIEKFVALARGLAQTVAALIERAEAVATRLRIVLSARLTEASVAVVGRWRLIKDVGTETGAIGRLGDEAASNVRLFADRETARRALPGDLSKVSNRFFRDATSKSRDFRIVELRSGGYRMDFFSPANNAGYGKRYVQVIDADGQIVTEYKDTLGPNGLIERKWIRE